MLHSLALSSVRKLCRPSLLILSRDVSKYTNLRFACEKDSTHTLEITHRTLSEVQLDPETEKCEENASAKDTESLEVLSERLLRLHSANGYRQVSVLVRQRNAVVLHPAMGWVRKWVRLGRGEECLYLKGLWTSAYLVTIGMRMRRTKVTMRVIMRKIQNSRRSRISAIFRHSATRSSE